MVDIETNKRFIEVMEYLSFIKNGKLTKSEFAKYLGVSPSTVGEIVSNSKSVGSAVLMGLSRMNPEINTSWILTGKGSMINGEEEPIVNRKHNKPKSIDKCQDCERSKLRVEILKELNSELKKEVRQLIEENAKLKNKLES